MKLDSVILAVEDQLGEAVSTKILKSFEIGIDAVIHEGGNEYLRKKAPELNRSANRMYVFLLTDSDTPQNCPPKLIRSWIKGSLNPKFLFRVAVMEVESWIMADREGFAKFLSIPFNRIPGNTDTIPDPKECLVGLARKSKKRRFREEIIPAPGSRNIVGYGYNTRLREFVREHWNLQNAAAVSPSLKRTLDRLTYMKDIESDK